MIRRPPRSTRTDTLFPYTTLFRSRRSCATRKASCRGRRPASIPVPYSQGMPSTSTMRSEEHTSELQSLMRISYAVFCLKKKNPHTSTWQSTPEKAYLLQEQLGPPLTNSPLACRHMRTTKDND